jgi:hypothetical protein
MLRRGEYSHKLARLFGRNASRQAVLAVGKLHPKDVGNGRGGFPRGEDDFGIPAPPQAIEIDLCCRRFTNGGGWHRTELRDSRGNVDFAAQQARQEVPEVAFGHANFLGRKRLPIPRDSMLSRMPHDL